MTATAVPASAAGVNVTTASHVTAAASTAGCGKAPALSSGTHTITSGGTSRRFLHPRTGVREGP